MHITDTIGTGKSACATQTNVNAAALLHPKVPPNAVEPFCNAVATLQVRENLDNAEPFDAALIFGGDGTVHRYLPQLAQSKVPFLVVPRGSGNDFAKTLGIRNEDTALRAWKEFCATGGNVREIDLGIVSSQGAEIPFCCVAGAGLDSVANARANRMPAWLRGTAGYLISALQALASFQPAEFALIATGQEVRRAGFLVAVGNAHRYGRGMKVVPRAELDDGLLDICLVGKMNKLKLLCCLPSVFFGAHLGIRQVEYFQSTCLQIETDPRLEVYTDGEYACLTPVSIKVLRSAMKVIVPG